MKVHPNDRQTCRSHAKGKRWIGQSDREKIDLGSAQVLPLCEEGVWRCPSCLDLCNCSGRSCSRFQKGLEPTEQLHSEAVRQGFKSVRAQFPDTPLLLGLCLLLLDSTKFWACMASRCPASGWHGHLHRQLACTGLTCTFVFTVGHMHRIQTSHVCPATPHNESRLL